MIRTWWFYFVTFVATLVFSSMSAIGGYLRIPHSVYNWIHRSWARSILASAGVRVEVEGLEHTPPHRGQILVSNHQSMFDIWAIMAAVPASTRFVAKEELSRIPIFARACRVAGHVFIDRRSASRAGEAIRRAGERMKREGLTLVLFAEGTRSPDGELGRFRKGAFALAIETQTVLIPTAIDGSGAILPPGGNRVRPGIIRIRLAPGVDLEGLTGADRDALAASTHATVRGLLEDMRGRPAVLDPPADPEGGRG